MSFVCLLHCSHGHRLAIHAAVILTKTKYETSLDRDDSYTLNTVESRYLELGYFEFCEVRSVYLNKKYMLIAFSNHNLVLETF